MSRLGRAFLFLLVASAATTPRTASADEKALAAGAQLGILSGPEFEGAAAIAAIEHSRGDPAGLDRFLVPDAPRELRVRAIIALGRIGARAGVESRLRALLAEGGDDTSLVIWAAGHAGLPGLVPSLLPFLDSKTPTHRGWAIYALGDSGERRADGYLLPLLTEKEASVTDPAGYSTVALGAERALEGLVTLAVESHQDVRARAVANAWRLAGARRKARSTKDTPWAGDAVLARRLAPFAAKDPDPEVRAFAHRALAILLAPTLAPNPDDPDDPVHIALAGAADPDPRVVADVASRFLSKYEGPGGAEALWTAGYDADPLVRETVAQTLAAKPTEARRAVAEDLLTHEQDARVRLQLAIAVAANGNLELARKALDTAKASGVDAALVGVALAKCLVGAKTDAAQRAELLALGRDEKAPPIVREAVLEVAGDIPEAEAAAYGIERCKDADPIVRASAASLVGDHGTPSDAPALAALYDPATGRTDQDFRAAIVEAVGKLVARPTGTNGSSDAAPTAASLLTRALDDSAPSVRLAAREAAKTFTQAHPGAELAKRAGAEDARPNDWKGLPRPKGPIAGLDFSQGEGSLSEIEIIRLADAIRSHGTQVAFETDAGTIVFSVDTVWTPVHAVNLVLAAAAGVYDGTLWHRVVPAFVIQGGDPRGDGSGDAGYSVPDEIAPHASFLRGTLGMPKSTKDTGGCQVFVMQMAAPHLDQHYTAFGAVVGGIEVVDRIRVGDRIRKASLVEAGAPAAK